MIEIPRRLPLAAQTATLLRQALVNGEWRELLPCERRLSEIFEVSRPTLRIALRSLAKEGILDIRQGRRIRVLAPKLPRLTASSRLVCIVLDEPDTDMHLSAYQSLSELRSRLAARGIATEMLRCQPRSAEAQRRRLEEYLRVNRVLCCVLMSARKELQQWFAERGSPALVQGSCHPSVRLPSLDVDYRSVCRHAAGVFLRHGHRRIAFVVPDSGVAGDLVSEQGFLEAGGPPHPGSPIRLTVERHNGTNQGIKMRLDALFSSASPPTALLVARPQYLFIVMCYLLRRGIRVPDDVSLISRDQDNLFTNVITPITHYRFEGSVYNHRLTRLMLKLADGSELSPSPHLIFPKFYPGESVKSLAS